MTLKKITPKGFTLIELLVVMFIIASLAAISFGIFFKMKDGANEKETKVLIKDIASNMEACREETGVPYPAGTGNTTDLVNYLTGDPTYQEFQDILNNTGIEVKPFMPSFLEDSGSKFIVNGEIVDSWKRNIEYTHDITTRTGTKNNFENGFDLKSTGLDELKDEDDIEL